MKRIEKEGNVQNSNTIKSNVINSVFQYTHTQNLCGGS